MAQSPWEASSDSALQGLSGVGATHVAFTLADARDQILARAATVVPVKAAPAIAPAAVPVTAMVPAMAATGG